MPKEKKDDKMWDLTSFESWSADHQGKVSRIAKDLVVEYSLSVPESLKLAVEIHRNIILQQALCAGSTPKPNPLEMIAIQMGASRYS
jgi:hypothetical protein